MPRETGGGTMQSEHYEQVKAALCKLGCDCSLLRLDHIEDDPCETCKSLAALEQMRQRDERLTKALTRVVEPFELLLACRDHEPKKVTLSVGTIEALRDGAAALADTPEVPR